MAELVSVLAVKFRIMAPRLGFHVLKSNQLRQPLDKVASRSQEGITKIQNIMVILNIFFFYMKNLSRDNITIIFWHYCGADSFRSLFSISNIVNITKN